MKICEKLVTILFVALIASLLSASARGLMSSKPLPVVEVRVLTLYEVCVEGTIVPAELLRAVARAESDEDDSAVGDGGWSIGRFQLNEKYHSMRARLMEYDPRDPGQAGVIAAHYLQDCIRAFPGDEDLGVTAYRWGIEGARAHGVDICYVERVMNRL
jgi:hypothetical protein